MAGVTDQPFRNLCRSQGAYWVVSEMVTSDHRLWDTVKSSHRLRFQTESEPRWIQIAGGDPRILAEAARLNVERGAQIIDINMGCPAKKVCNKMAGSALMRDEQLVGRILESVVNAVDVPVTLKIRLGWSLQEKNAQVIARMAESTGVQLLTVHGRSRACRFTGQVDYEAIGEIVQSVSIPVIANGDIDSETKAADVLSQTGAAAVMVGRAAQGRPWLVAQIDHYLKTGKLKKSPGLCEVKTILISHIKNLAEFYGEVMGPRIARKHVGWYFRGISKDYAAKDYVESSFLREFNGLSHSQEQIQAIENALMRINERTGQAA
ncbi:MAG TPA: tRNA dihydrouridine synthase DusB [Gammaproteobacteria bacterium]|nr:tRNA dihydrouridine synthase DusB [Gammaproteobacteria bacterium]HIL95766.1 tRNA dihydrouridine synthase DusB [Pseudomonadales bacterium]